VSLRDFSSDLAFPVLLWRKGYSYVAGSALELCTHPRSLFPETRKRAQQGEFKLADSHGRIFSVTDFEPVRPFGGLMRVPHILLRSVFAQPVCAPAEVPELSGFQSAIGKVVSSRFGKSFVTELQQTSSAAAAMQLLARRERKAG
jgi:hypothetical protein